MWIANSKENAPILAPFLFGTLERLLLPFGLHHMLTIPINYTQLGGTYEVLTGAAKGTKVLGQEPLWLAWVTDLANLKGAHPYQYRHLLEAYTPARFKVGQMIGSFGILMGMVVAIYRNVDDDKKHQYKGMLTATVLATFLTGVTEPIEYMFMFVATPLYIIYAFVQLYTLCLDLSIRNTALTCGYSLGNPAASRTVSTMARVALAALPLRSNWTTDTPAAPACTNASDWGSVTTVWSPASPPNHSMKSRDALKRFHPFIT